MLEYWNLGFLNYPALLLCKLCLSRCTNQEKEDKFKTSFFFEIIEKGGIYGFH